METYCLVRPEYLNHQGYLFGGQLLKWVDEFTWIAATREFPDSTLVTRAMDKIEFHSRVANGTTLRFQISLFKKGVTSVTYSTEVFAENGGSKTEHPVFSTRITFVALNKKGDKVVL